MSEYRLIIKAQAEIDLLEAAQWYERQQEGLGGQFLDAVDDKLMKVVQNTLLHQLRYKMVRFALINRFPFAIHYKVEDKTIFIIAVLSTHRNPRIWEE